MGKAIVARRFLSYNRIIFILSLAGVLIAAYVLQSFIRQTPIVCVNTGCELVRKSPYGYILGIPVPGVGLVGYSLLALFAFLQTTTEKKELLYGILGISTFGVLFVTWFTYMELFVIKAVCTWCAISAVNMVVIFIYAVKIYLLGKKKNENIRRN